MDRILVKFFLYYNEINQIEKNKYFPIPLMYTCSKEVNWSISWRLVGANMEDSNRGRLDNDYITVITSDNPQQKETQRLQMCADEEEKFLVTLT